MAKGEKDTTKRREHKRSKESKEKSNNDNTAASIDVEAEMQELLKSGVWKALTQEGTGKTYYYHTKTKQTCWDLRKELQKQRAAAAASGTTAAAVETNINTTTEKEKEKEKEKKSSKKSKSTEVKEKKEKEEEKVKEEEKDKTVENTEIQASPVTHTLTEKKKKKKKNTSSNSSSSSNSSTPHRQDSSLDVYRDPLARLVEETQRLQQITATNNNNNNNNNNYNYNNNNNNNSHAMALEFQRSYDALSRTNRALTTQMLRMKEEYDAMALALKEAHRSLYEKDRALRQQSTNVETINTEVETARTLASLREQNQELVRQVGELSVTLARGFGELAYQHHMITSTSPTSNAAAVEMSPEALAAHPLQLRRQQESLGSTLDRLLANPITQKMLCRSCTEELEKLRLSLLPEDERVATATEEENNRTGLPPKITTSTTTWRGNPQHSHEMPFNASGPSFNRFGNPMTAAAAAAGAYTSSYPPSYYPSQQQPQQHQQQQQQQGYYGLENTPDGWQSQLNPHPQRRSSSDAYADHFPDFAMNRRSESRVSTVSATPVFGGFRIRPAS
ncbi:uncharacterized protein TM35_000212070 [Trypanosoma theileri]|uniref:WW domain-containing protein n=1 Tax=Trypanosoma theileri TaxID=67003 RepID=A0A1X0NSM7_9TRYP|nr:uncharacterized protein TM35_000212070 [Trypanosoma theileri]ORC87601.1 hypothetical protein TM35_000212070 [Trypanosoma theileri]